MDRHVDGRSVPVLFYFTLYMCRLWMLRLPVHAHTDTA